MQQMQVRFTKKNDERGLVLLDRVILQEARGKVLCLREKAGPSELNKWTIVTRRRTAKFFVINLQVVVKFATLGAGLV